jgi:hypothetical protein
MVPPAEDVRRFSVVTVALAVLALGFVVLVGLRSALATPAGPVVTPPTPGPMRTTGYATPGPVGVPSIQPRATMKQANAAGPYYTEADVRQFVATHRPDLTVAGTPNPVVVSGQFLTAKQASAQVSGEEIAASDSTLVCLVFVSGIFNDSSWSPFGGTPNADSTFTQGWIVFDAHTGNELVSTVG